MMNVEWIIVLGIIMIYREWNGRSRWWYWMNHSIVVHIVLSIWVRDRQRDMIWRLVIIGIRYVKYVRVNSSHRLRG